MLEHTPEVNYSTIQQFIDRVIVSKGTAAILDKRVLTALLGLATSDRDRQLIRYTAYHASGLSKTAARKQFGFRSTATLCSAVEHAIEEVRYIREFIDELAHIKEKAALAAIGVHVSDSSSSGDSDTEDSTDDLSCNEVFQEAQQERDTFNLGSIAKSADFNCFEIISKLEEYAYSEVLKNITLLHQRRHDLKFTAAEISKLELSFAALQFDIQNSET